MTGPQPAALPFADGDHEMGAGGRVTDRDDDALAFDAVYDRYFDYVHRLVARLAGTSDPDDLVQEVFLVVHRRLRGFEGRASLTTWLFRIAYRVVGAHIRRERLRRALRTALGWESEPVEPPRGPLLVEQAEQAAALAAALGSLSWKKRAVIVLHEVEGWPCRDIARRLGVPVDTVYTRLHHARRELATALVRAGHGRRGDG
jgi:RNA polymerase sigma-70 factor (ECF subfamily)